MVESTRFRRVLSCLSLLFFLCTLPAMPAYAQAVISPSSATLEATSIDESASTTFTVSPFDTIAGIYLCVPTCSNENYASGSGTVRDGASEWALDGSDCLSRTTESDCAITVKYTAGDASVSTAELQVDMGYYGDGLCRQREHLHRNRRADRQAPGAATGHAAVRARRLHRRRGRHRRRGGTACRRDRR